ncbi:ribonuclease III domain-containing protein [Colletotrichum cereale]|nr:ribonuclease III domain-containing protein [Colletotrichum cereale]
MSKRSSSGALPPSKRRHTEDEALGLLLDHSNELIRCLRNLSKMKSDSSFESEDLRNLRCLSNKLLPSFKQLACEGSTQDETERGDGASSIKKEEIQPAPSAPPIPSFTLVTPWTPADIPSSMPPLPKISNPVLEMAAFTHVGMLRHKTDLSYERLEWLGDAYLELISSSLIFQTFGGFSTGKCSQLRELLIRNANLGEYSAHYKLFERARLPSEFRSNGNLPAVAKPHEIQKVHGDLFEAYAAAVVLSDPVHGLSQAAEWLKALWATTIQDQIKTHARNPGMGMVKELGGTATVESQLPPKVRLSQAIGCKGIQIRYEDMPSGNKKDKYNKKLALFTVGVYLDGWGEKNKLLGTGSDLNKKEAGQKAAQMALFNNKLMKVYREKKRAFMAALGEPEVESN